MNKTSNIRVRNIEALSFSHCSTGKAVVTTYSEFVFIALGNQHAKRMRHIILSSVAFLIYHIFAHYLINGLIFR